MIEAAHRRFRGVTALYRTSSSYCLQRKKGTHTILREQIMNKGVRPLYAPFMPRQGVFRSDRRWARGPVWRAADVPGVGASGVVEGWARPPLATMFGELRDRRTPNPSLNPWNNPWLSSKTGAICACDPPIIRSPPAVSRFNNDIEAVPGRETGPRLYKRFDAHHLFAVTNNRKGHA